MTTAPRQQTARPTVIETPCVKICTIDDDGLCAGCSRSLDEIARWGSMAPTERQRIMAELPKRKIKA